MKNEIYKKTKNYWLFSIIVITILTNMGAAKVFADSSPSQTKELESESQVIQKFTEKESIDSEIITIGDKKKRQIMFAMGVPLLFFIAITVALGIAMGVFGKDVYIAHMIFAGLSLTLAMGHAIVGLVWFWPF